MKEKSIVVLIVLVVAIGLASFGVGYFFAKQKKTPQVQVIDSTTMLEVSQELSIDSVQEIQLSGENVNVRIEPSDSSNIQIIYKPIAETKNFTYELMDGVLKLRMEKTTSMDSFIPDESQIVYVYLPEKSAVRFSNVTESGYLNVEQVHFASFSSASTSGIVSLEDVRVDEDVKILTTTGKVVMKKTSFQHANVKTAGGLVAVYCAGYQKEYEVKANSDKGGIFLNGELVKTIQNEEVEEERPTITVKTSSGDIHLGFQEETFNE